MAGPLWPILSITARTTKRKDELPADRIYRQCHPRFIEVAFLSQAATSFFAHEQLLALQDRYLASGKGLEIVDATVVSDNDPLGCPWVLVIFYPT